MSETTAEYNTKNVVSTDRTLSSPKQLARIGIFYIEEAILEVLLEARETTPEDPFVRRVEIRRRIGVYNLYFTCGWSIGDFLKKLKVEERIEQEVRGRYSFWKLSEAEYQKRC